MRKLPIILVGVIGGATESEATLSLAETVGRLIAERGALLLCGGLGGVMEAAGRGARRAGGTVVGILPGTDPSQANAFVSVPIATGLREARNAVIATAAQGFIAVGGEWGTLSEISLGKKLGKPAVLLSPGSHTVPGLPVATDPQDAVERLWADLGLIPSEKD